MPTQTQSSLRGQGLSFFPTYTSLRQSYSCWCKRFQLLVKVSDEPSQLSGLTGY